MKKYRRCWIIKELQINEDIREKEVRLIDDDGSQLGVVPIKKAMEIANEKKLDFLTPKMARQYMQTGEFKEGSMLPKIEACLSFVEHRRGGQALITSLDKANEALQGKTGTIISREGV